MLYIIHHCARFTFKLYTECPKGILLLLEKYRKTQTRIYNYIFLCSLKMKYKLIQFN